MAARVTAANTRSGNHAPRWVSRTCRVRSRVADKRSWGSSRPGPEGLAMQLGLHNKPLLSRDQSGLPGASQNVTNQQVRANTGAKLTLKGCGDRAVAAVARSFIATSGAGSAGPLDSGETVKLKLAFM